MALGSFAHGALVDLSPDDLSRMLELDETLFVEHKSDLGRDSAYGLASSVASFANTLGGWVLVGVKNGAPTNSESAWADPDHDLTLVDAVRDRLRDQIDPLPAFEAKVLSHPDGPIGVIRVYESSDTPHVVLQSGAVFVREVAGVTDAGNPARPGAGSRGERAYRAAQIRSRAQLVELALRGEAARERATSLVDPRRPLPLMLDGLGLAIGADGLRLPGDGCASIVVRLAPYTLSPRFRQWATTPDAATAVLRAGEALSHRAGLSSGWLDPHPAGVAVSVGLDRGRAHRDDVEGGLDATARIALDGAGAVGAALELAGPDEGRRRSRVELYDLADNLIRPVLDAATGVLAAGEFIGRAWCQVDIVALPVALLLEGQGDQEARPWVPTGAELALPVEDEQATRLVRHSANAYARSARLPAWDSPARS